MEKIKKIVVVGASAGGLDALNRFIKSLPENEDIPYVIIQHQKPSHKSMLTQLLSKYTKLPVKEISNGDKLSIGVNVAPSGYNTILDKDEFVLEESGEGWMPTPSVDYFLLSVAEEFKQDAIAVILSGTGSDGSHGCKAIKSEGGIVFSQELSSAGYTGMPQSVIEQGLADFILKPEDMGLEIENIINKKVVIEKEKELDWYEEVLKTLFAQTGVDFSKYKEGTIRRRLERRLLAAKLPTLKEYASYLEENEKEIQVLYKDILIGVTSFFRDPNAYEDLSKRIEDIIDEKDNGDYIRVWTAGCSSGEEAYSISMLIHEKVIEKRKALQIQVFATDIDEDSINQGRRALYSPVAAETLTDELKTKYLIPSNGRFEVAKSIRESIIFSKHNMLVDPPFVKLDLIVCRNVLIYFQNELQRTLLNTFYYSLNYNGVLFLGRSENISQAEGMFKVLDEKSKIFKKVPGKFKVNTFFQNKKMPQFNLNKETMFEVESKKPFEDIVAETMFKFYPGSLVIINERYEVQFTKGSLHPYISLPEGELRNNIFKMVNDVLSIEIRTLLHRAKEEENVVFSGVLFDVKKGISPVQISVYPVKTETDERFFVICFAKKEELDEFSKNIESSDKEQILEHELRATKEYLQTVIEELETSNEELQSINEEFQASNEELQASNEELETSNEELQATNEELQSAYTELKAIYKEKEAHRKELVEIKESLEDKNSALKQTQSELQRSEYFINTVFNITSVGIAAIDEEGNFVRLNSTFCKIYEYEERELLNQNFSVLFKNEEREAESKKFQDFLEESDSEQLEKTITTRNGKNLEVSISSRKLTLDDGRKYKVVVIDDITDRKDRENALALVAKVFENTTESIVITDKYQKILQVNEAAERITGYSADELVGQTPRILKSSWHDEEFYKVMYETLHEQGVWEGEIWDRRKTGEVYISWFLILMIKDKHGEITNYIAISNEITDKKEQEEKIKHLAYFDSLTKLPNRTLFFDRLEQAIERAKRRKNYLAVAFIDLDRFKNINDTYGHEIGDRLLKTVSTRIQRLMRKEDTVARIGGDEFTLIFENVNEPSAIIPKIDAIIESIEVPIIFDKIELFTSASIGISIFPNDGENAHELLKHADLAMYESKSAGKNTYNFFTKEMNEKASKQIILESGLKKAIEYDELKLLYQPQYSLKDMKIAGVEALLRWEHSELGTISPVDFIPIAEDSGLIVPIGEWVLEQAMRDLLEVYEQSGETFKLAVNFSSIQLQQKGIVQTIISLCEKVGFNKENLEVEITESVVMDKTESSSNVLNEINENSIDLSIDDFGTGYSSLSYLKSIPCQRLKIDRAFVKDTPEDEEDKAIVKMIIALAHTMGTEDRKSTRLNSSHLEFLKAEGCDIMQGYYKSKPIDKESLIRLIVDE